MRQRADDDNSAARKSKSDDKCRHSDDDTGPVDAIGNRGCDSGFERMSGSRNCRPRLAEVDTANGAISEEARKPLKSSHSATRRPCPTRELTKGATNLDRVLWYGCVAA